MVTVCAAPVVPSIDLKTRILERVLSTFRILTLSDPTVKMSFSRKFKRFPVTLKNVTIPVTPSVPIPEEVVPKPATVRVFVVIPAT